jgi:zinc protease
MKNNISFSLPALNSISSIQVPEVKCIRFPNGVPVYIISGGKSKAIKVDFIYQAGAWFAKKGLIAHFCNEMLLEGTATMTGNKLMERLDFYGSYVQPFAEKDYAGVSLYGIESKITPMLKIVEPMLKASIFPAESLQTILQKKKQQFIIDQAKPKVIASRETMRLLFGANHPYGWLSTEQDFDQVQREDLLDHFHSYYGSSNLSIIVSGKVNPSTVRSLENYFGQSTWLQSDSIKPSYTPAPSSLRVSHLPLENAVQSAIRIGSLIVSRKHEDYIGLQVLTLILGGYFGSRLMKNLREDKAFTYSIGAYIQNFAHSSLLVISTEVGKEYGHQAIEEIWKEMHLLQIQAIDADELQRVKNYFLGNLLHNFEGPINASDAFRSLWEAGFDFSFVDQIVQKVRTISPAEITILAQKYFNRADFVEVIAG